MHKKDVAATFFRFNQLTLDQKLSQLNQMGILLDTDVDGDKLVKLYFIQGFFVEQIVCRHTGAHIELIPYKNGYRVYNFLN